ncbi:MAG: alpha/beta fold hydrolase [Actinomycetes bacterium]
MEASRSARRSGRRIALAGLLTGAEIGIAPRRARRDRCGRPVTVTADDGVRLAADVDECPAPHLAVVFAHGWLLDRRSWRFQRRALAGTATLVRYDHRGHGGSAPGPEGSLTVDRLGDDLAAVLDRAVPPDVPVVLAGHAMGAVAILSLAARRGELFGGRIVGAALLSPSCGRLVSGGPPERWWGADRPPEPDPAEGPVRLAPVIPFPRSSGRYAGHAVSPGVAGRTACPLPQTHVAAPASRGVPHSRLDRRRDQLGGRCAESRARATRDHIRFVGDRVAAAPPASLPGFFHDLLLREDPAPLAALRRVETLIMVGSADRVTPPAHGRRIADLLPDATLTVVAGAGHLITLERPDVVNRALRGFLLGCRARAGR